MTVGSGLAAGDSDGAAVEDGVGATTAGAIAAGDELGETEPDSENRSDGGGISASRRTPASFDDAASGTSNSTGRWRCTPGWCLMPVNENMSMKRLTASAVTKETTATTQLGKCRRCQVEGEKRGGQADYPNLK